MNIRKLKSLRGSVVLLITLCWALPLLVMSVTGGWYIIASQKDNVAKDAELENRYNARMTVKILDDAVLLSRNLSRLNATNLGSLYNIWRNGGAQTRYTGVKTLLNRLMAGRITGAYRDYEMAGVVFFDAPQDFFSVSNREWAGDSSFPKTLEELVDASREKDGGIRFFIDGDYVYLMRNLLDRRDFSPFGTVIFCMRTEQVMGNFLQSGERPYCVDFWLNSEYGNIGGEGNAHEPNLRQVSAGQIAADEISFKGLSLVTYGISSANRDISLSVVLHWRSQPLWHDIQVITVVYLVMALSSLLILLGALRFFRTHVTRPLDTLHMVSEQLEAGDLGVQAAPFDKNRDFQKIIGAFNSMSCELKKQFDRIYDEELALKDAKIMALRSQINPHFLNNTLELMNWQALLVGQSDISEMISALSLLLDASLNRSDTREVSLREELAYADAFIFILSKRYGDRLRIEKSVDQRLLSVPVPPLVIQPLLENAVEHGFEKNREKTIALNIGQDGDYICLEVVNSGELGAADRDRIERLLGPSGEKRGAHLGILNIRERLRLLYGGSESFSITSDGEVTSARITIPLKRENEQA